MPDAQDRAENPYRMLLEGAKKRGVKCTITEEQYLEMVASGKCHYCRRALNATGHKLDRKDSKGDYTVENCVPCCWTCNRAKGANISFEDFFKMQEPIRLEVQLDEVKAEWGWKDTPTTEERHDGTFQENRRSAFFGHLIHR